ncbi:hypothetical protein [Sphaerotilus microaerophilus]|nr:hypothetical protein [Sphaerotilus sp. FB-5]
MRLMSWWLLALAAFAVLGCSGGGGESDPSISVDRSTVSVSATPAEAAPVVTVLLSAQDMPAEGLYLSVDSTYNGVQSVSWTSPSEDRALIEIRFFAPGQLPNGVYRDTVTISVCRDGYCARHVNNSPLRIPVTYTVSGSYNADAQASADRTQVVLTASKQDAVLPVASVVVSSSEALPGGVYVQATSSGQGIASVTSTSLSPTQTRVDVSFLTPQSLDVGRYDGSVTLRVCIDSSCNRALVGSPLTLATQYTVNNEPIPEPGLTPIDVASRAALPHDVVDAEYSRALDSVVMVASWPSPALYIHDTRTGTERRVALAKVPTAVSVSPDGRQAAVGHDALVSIVDLTAASPVVRTLQVSANVYDLVLDGSGRVHAFPRSSQWEQLHTIDVATNTETLVQALGGIYGNTRARLSPSGTSLYMANSGLSPDDIAKIDLTTSPPSYLYDSPYHGEYAMCSNLWFKEDGSTIYTACGNTLRSSSVKANDLIYAGRLALSSDSTYGYRIVSLSQSSLVKEVALIEMNSAQCLSAYEPLSCKTHLNLYESDFLNRSSVRSIPPVSVGGVGYAQEGRFVFHSADGSVKWLISRLVGMPDPASEYQLVRLR